MRAPGILAHSYALTFAAAIIGWSVLLAPTSRPVRAIATKSEPLATKTIAAASQRVRHAPPPVSIHRGSDVVPETYRLRDGQLAALHVGDHVVLPNPDGGVIQLRVERVESTPAGRHLLLTHDGLPSTFTQSHGQFFGTLATAHGVYALEGSERQGWLTRHTQLDQRMNSNALDYRSLPSG